MPKNKRRRKRNKPVQSVPKPDEPDPKPVKPVLKPVNTYASIMSSRDDKSVQVAVDDTDDTPDFIPISTTQRHCVTNYTPPRGNSDRGAWELAYIRQLFELRRIFISGMKQISPDVDTEYLLSAGFMDNFSQFIYEASSHYISPHLEPLTEKLEEAYEQYIIKRDDFNN